MRSIAAIILIALGTGFIACDEVNEIAKEPFVGTWLITEVALDGIMQRGWTGLEIQIEQDSVDSGSYSVTDTPDESVWKKNGIWRKHPSGFVRDNEIDVTYAVNDVEFMTNFLIPQLPEPCLDGACILPIKGRWVFTAKKR